MSEEAKQTRAKPDPTMPARWKPKFLNKMDSRLSLVQQIRRIQNDLAEETGATSIIKRALVDRFTFLLTMLQTMEVEALEEGRLDAAAVGRWTQATNALTGIAKQLGLEKKAHRVGSLRTYVETKREGVA